MRSVCRRQRQWFNETFEDFGVNQQTHSLSTDGYTVSVTKKKPKDPARTMPTNDETGVE